MKPRKFFVSLLVVVLLSTMLFAQGAKEDTANNSKKLTMMFSSGGAGNSLTAAAQKFGELNGVEMEALTFPIGEVYEKQILALSSRQGTPDIIAIDDTWFPVLMNYLEPIQVDSQVAEDIIPSYLNAFAKDGVQYAVPVRMGGEVIAYRTDVFEAAGIDPESMKTWDDVLAVAQKLYDPVNKVYSWVGGYSEPAYLVMNWLNILSGYGVDAFNEDQTGFAFNSEQGVKATKTFIELTKCASPGILSYGYNEEIEAFQNGSAIMGELWTARYASINKDGLPYSGKFGVLPFTPIGDGVVAEYGVNRVNGWGLGVNKYSKNKELAQDFLNFVASYDEQLRLAVEFSNSPTVGKVFDNAEYLEVVPVASNMESAIAHGITRPMHLKWSEMEATISTNLQKAIIGELTVEEALARAEASCLRILND